MRRAPGLQLRLVAEFTSPKKVYTFSSIWDFSIQVRLSPKRQAADPQTAPKPFFRVYIEFKV